MFYDLNIPWPVALPERSTASSSKKAREKKADEAKVTGVQTEQASLSSRQRSDLRAVLIDAAELGFQTIAFNFPVKTRFESALHRNPLAAPKSNVTLAPFPDLDRLTATKSSEPRLHQLSRMTLVMDDDSMGKHGHGITATNQSGLMTYDLLSAQPNNDTSFSALCLSMTELKPISIDIISLDFASSPRPPFFMRRSLVHTAIANGAVFEICYARTVHRGRGDDNAVKARRNIISATRELLRVTNGRGVILSSGTSDLLGLRGPYDVINLASVLGMNPTAAQDAISSCCRSLLLRAETRKTFRGVVDDVKVVMTYAAEPGAGPTGTTTTATTATTTTSKDASPPPLAKKRKDQDEQGSVKSVERRRKKSKAH